MAAELSFRHTAKDATVKATIRKMLTVDGKIQMWSTLGEPDAGFVNLAIADWENYVLPMTETPASSYAYVGSWPATLTEAGWYVVDFYDGATIAGTLAGTFLGYWDGTTFGLGGADTRQIAGSAPAAAKVASSFNGTGDLDDVDFVVRNFHVFSDTDHAVWFKSTFATGDGLHCEGVVNGQCNYGGDAGQSNTGGYTGQYNSGGETGQINYGTSIGQFNYGPTADVQLANSGTITNDSGNVIQIGSAAALAAYDSDGGVAKQASVGAIATILSGITSLAAWLRGLYRKDTINSTALSEINAIHDGGAAGTFSATTDSNEAIADKTSGLTAQETRNALKLAPSTGTPAAGSIDAELDAIGLKTATIGSGRITYASTVGEAALATIWAGDDYRAADGTQFSITVTDYAGPSLATATAVLRIMDSAQYLSAVDGVSVKADLEVPATITINGTTITLAADLTAAQTAALATSPPAAGRNYIFEFVCTLANTHVGYRTHGQMTVKKAVS